MSAPRRPNRSQQPNPAPNGEPLPPTTPPPPSPRPPKVTPKRPRKTQTVPARATKPNEVGVSGLAVRSGQVREGRDPLFYGKPWREEIAKMLNSDPIIGGIFAGIDLKIAKATRNLAPADDSPEALFVRDHIASCFDDMNQPFGVTIPQITTMLAYGWSYFEVVPKLRMGPSPLAQTLSDGRRRQPPASKHDDGLIGWHKWGHRHPDTLAKWDFAPDGTLRGMVQHIPTTQEHKTIPITRSLLFRPRYLKGNPEGKALAHETPLPTPDGWRTIGDLQPGDRVFDEQGMIRHVTAVAEWNDRPVYEVVFSSGDAIVADAAHDWLTHDAAARYRNQPAAIRTTAEIAQSVEYGSQQSANHAIPLAKPWRYVRQHVPIDPYAFGYWLGDGTTASSEITTADTEIVDFYRDLGYPIERKASTPYGYRVRGGLQKQLRSLGVLDNKHVPDAYLQGDREQRLGLLQGLMDSDGSVDGWGRCEFSNANPLLSAAVAELARSLGCKASVSRKLRAEPQHKDAILVKFTPAFPAFRLPRKLAKQKFDRDLKSRRNYHYITEVRALPPRSTKCIEVDSPSHLFLCGWNGIPTHNSTLTSAWRAWYFKRNIEQAEAEGMERELTGFLLFYVTQNLLDPEASASEQAALQGYKDLLDDMRTDPTTGAILPSVYDAKGNQLMKVDIVKSGGTRQYDTGAMISRWNHAIAFTMLAQFMLLGTEKVGSFALSSTQADLFIDALNTWCDAIADVINVFGIRRLVALNGWDIDLSPTLSFSRITDSGVGEIADTLQKLGNAGMSVFPNAPVEREILRQMGLPNDGVIERDPDEIAEDSGGPDDSQGGDQPGGVRDGRPAA